MGLDEKIACSINVVVGAVFGFVIYLFPLGLIFLALGWTNTLWLSFSFWLCVGGGGMAGFFAYKNRLKNLDIDSREQGLFARGGDDLVGWRRMGIILFGLLPFISFGNWQSIRAAPSRIDTDTRWGAFGMSHLKRCICVFVPSLSAAAAFHAAIGMSGADRDLSALKPAISRDTNESI